ncbi:uncharacterized protein METZ01_LOCUS488148, partial [marine metagenome]
MSEVLDGNDGLRTNMEPIKAPISALDQCAADHIYSKGPSVSVSEPAKPRVEQPSTAWLPSV